MTRYRDLTPEDRRERLKRQAIRKKRKRDERRLKLGLETQQPGRNPKATLEHYDPNAAAQITEYVTNQYDSDVQSLEEIAKRVGFPQQTVRLLIKRLKTRYQPLKESLQKITTKGLIELIEDRTSRALHHMDDFVMAQASFKDLAVGLGILIEKRQLLRGEPTQILDHTERQNLNVLIPVVIQEAQRRGFTIDVDPTTQEVRVIGERMVRNQLSKELSDA